MSTGIKVLSSATGGKGGDGCRGSSGYSGSYISSGS